PRQVHRLVDQLPTSRAEPRIHGNMHRLAPDLHALSQAATRKLREPVAQGSKRSVVPHRKRAVRAVPRGLTDPQLVSVGAKYAGNGERVVIQLLDSNMRFC
ncbi:hypothetical protein F441_17945, partial [Phytophthora nicotianae CJ01A1]